MILRAFLAWLLLMVLAILNGVFREAVLTPRLGAAASHAASTLILCGLIAATWALIGWIGPATTREALRVSALWLVLTLTFELGFGRLVVGRTWAELLADYDVLRGRIWVLVLLTIAVAPPLAASARGLVAPGAG